MDEEAGHLGVRLAVWAPARQFSRAMGESHAVLEATKRLGRLSIHPCLGAQVTEESDKAEALKAFKRKLEERRKDLSKA